MPGLTIYLGGLLVLAACVMGTLAGVTTVQVLRLRNKRLSWRAGTLKGFPLFSTLFLVISVILASSMWFKGDFWAFSASIAYLFVAVSWFVSSYFSSKRYITDHGIVKNVNDPAQTVAWHQIRDFFEQKKEGEILYTFIYSEEKEKNAYKVVRLEVHIPSKKHEAFKKLIAHKLGRRISCYEDSNINVEHFN